MQKNTEFHLLDGDFSRKKNVFVFNRVGILKMLIFKKKGVYLKNLAGLKGQIRCETDFGGLIEQTKHNICNAG